MMRTLRHLSSSVPPLCTSAHARRALPTPFPSLCSQARRLAHTAVHAKRMRKRENDEAPFPLLSTLNAQQLAAATEDSDAVYVKAGPGTGKTRTVAAHVEHLVMCKNIDASSILVLTHSKSAAAELEDRLMGKKFKGIHASTFHSICAKALRGNFPGISASIEDLRAGVGKDFKILGDEEAQDALQLALSKHPAFKKAQQKTLDQVAETLKGVISATKNLVKHTMGPKTDILHTIATGLANKTFPINNLIADKSVPDVQDLLSDPVFLTDMFGRYQSELAINHALDFADLLSFTVALLSKNVEARVRYNAYFSHIVIDEFQDANTPQLELAKLLKGYSGSLFVVGDEDQQIYSWRCLSTARAGERFLQEWPHAQLMFLTRNYRSGGTILNAATAVLSHGGIPEGYQPPEPLPHKTSEVHHISVDRGADSRAVARLVQQMLQDGEKADSIAILVRTKFQALEIQGHLRLLKIDHNLLGMPSLWDNKLVKNSMRFLRLCLDPVPGTLAHTDTAGFACIHLGLAISNCAAGTTSSLSHATKRKNVMTQLAKISEERGLSQNMLLFGDLLDVWIEGTPLMDAQQMISDFAGRNSWCNLGRFTKKDALKAARQQSDEVQAFLAPLVPDLCAADLPGLDQKAISDFNSFRRILVLARSAARVGDMQGCLWAFLDGTGFRVSQVDASAKALRLEELEGNARGTASFAAKGLEPCNVLKTFTTLPDRVDGKEDTKKKDHVSILTMHKSKGMEFTNVIVPAFNDGSIPLKTNEKKVQQGKRLPANMEEEARLAFVAITRAEQRLFFIGLALDNGASRFANELVELEERMPGSINFVSQSPPAQNTWP